MLGISTGGGEGGGAETITAGQIARGAGDAMPRRAQSVDRSLGEADLHPAARGDERSLERLLRVQPGRLIPRAAEFDRGVPQGLRADLPDRARRPAAVNQRLRRAEASPGHAARSRRTKRADRVEPAGLRQPRPTRQLGARRTTPATPMSTWSATTSTTSAARRTGLRPSASTSAHPNKPFAFPNGVCGESTTRASSPDGEVRPLAPAYELLGYYRGRPGLGLRPRHQAPLARLLQEADRAALALDRAGRRRSRRRRTAAVRCRDPRPHAPSGIGGLQRVRRSVRAGDRDAVVTGRVQRQPL